MTTQNRGRKRNNIDKDVRKYRLSHEAFLIIQKLAKEQHIEPAAFLEVHTRELARERLTQEQRAQIQAEAQRISQERLREAEAEQTPS